MTHKHSHTSQLEVEILNPPPKWATALSGALAGVISRFSVNPLDVLKIRFQIQLEPTSGLGQRACTHGSKYRSICGALATIIREEGVRGLWRGNLAGQLMTVPYTTAQFTVLQQCKAFAMKHGIETYPATSFVSGAIAGTAGTIASYPLDLLRTTLAAQGEPKVYKGIVDAARGIVAKNGIAGLYRGLSITIIEIIPYSALQFGLYDHMNRLWSLRKGDRSGRSRGALQSLVCGLISGTVSKLATHPLDLAKKRFQVAGMQRALHYGRRIPLSTTSSIRGCLVDIVRTEGFLGLYKGVGPSLLKAAPAAAITLASYEFMLGYFVALNFARKKGATAQIE